MQLLCLQVLGLRVTTLLWGDPKSPLRNISFQLQTLQSENMSLRRQATSIAYQAQPGCDYADAGSHSSLKRRPSARSSRPMSMYETGSGQKPYLPLTEVAHPEENIVSRLQPFPSQVSKTAALTLFSFAGLSLSFSAPAPAPAPAPNTDYGCCLLGRVLRVDLCALVCISTRCSAALCSSAYLLPFSSQ